MGRALLAVGTLLVALIAVLIVAVLLTQEEESFAVDNRLAENLSREIATAEDNRRQVDLAAVADFEWDEVLILADDAPPEVLEEELGSDFPGELNYDVESDELFVFLRDGEVVRYADYRGLGRFARLEQPIDRLSREEAVFEVRDLVARPVGASD
jgi:hypothetical protein